MTDDATEKPAPHTVKRRWSRRRRASQSRGWHSHPVPALSRAGSNRTVHNGRQNKSRHAKKCRCPSARTQILPDPAEQLTRVRHSWLLLDSHAVVARPFYGG